MKEVRFYIVLDRNNVPQKPFDTSFPYFFAVCGPDTEYEHDSVFSNLLEYAYPVFQLSLYTLQVNRN